MQMPDGTLVAREKGTPQGSPISPLLANLFMHYAFDRWMDREHPGSPFERYADDAVIHCDTEAQARNLGRLAERLGPWDSSCTPKRRRSCTARTRTAEGTSSTPASTSSATPSGDTRCSAGEGSSRASTLHQHQCDQGDRQEDQVWHLNRRSRTDLSSLAREINPRYEAGSTITGPSTAPSCMSSHGASTSTWSDGPCKFKRLRGQALRAWAWLEAVRQHQPALFAHWHLVARTQKSACGSPVKGDFHAGFCESRGVRFPPALTEAQTVPARVGCKLLLPGGWPVNWVVDACRML